LGEKEAGHLEKYKRYQITESGVSPRSIPSAFGLEVAADSHEHDEDGHITEDAQVRKSMMEKRFRKLDGLSSEIGPPQKIGDKNVDTLLVGWGSTYGPMAECIEMLNREGISVGGMHLNELWPFPRKEVSEVLERVKKWAVVENNYTGQLARLIQMELQKAPDGKILKYDGRPFMATEIAEGFKKEVMGR
jgi:2-oxoglutarate ferredoxin oxidoreductase subunit alpha